MTARSFVRALGLWGALTAIMCVGVCRWARIEPQKPPPRDAERWALEALDAARLGEPAPEPPASAKAYESANETFVFAWWQGRVAARYVGPSNLAEAVRGAAKAFSENQTLRQTEGYRAGRRANARVRFTVTVTQGEGPLLLALPYVSNLAVVALEEGIVVELDGKRASVTPDELHASRAYELGVQTPLPDLKFGIRTRLLVDRLARELGVDFSEVQDRGSARRFRAYSITEATYPKDETVGEDNLRRAAVEGARFTLRHQAPSGKYTYIYDGRWDSPRGQGAYNLPRHAGTSWFLALLHNLHGMPEAREGAIRALRWVKQHHAKTCGAPDRICLVQYGQVDLGSAALSAVAAAEVLEGGDVPEVRELLVGLTAFLRSQQRPDGELMHVYDRRTGKPVDVQYLYYSGEGALALLKAHAVLGDRRDLEAAQKLMKHLTGASWSFLGSRYYYGEEHWTCMAAEEAGDRIDAAPALDFCRRWAAYNREIQFREGETPWDTDGAYGVGPLIVPRMTPVASRSEAFVSTYKLSVRHGIDDPALRAQVERGLAMLLRWRWAPGPTHLLKNPAAAQGGIPGSPVELLVRNDYVQHAGSAMIRWADMLRREREKPRTARAERP